MFGLGPGAGEEGVEGRYKGEEKLAGLEDSLSSCVRQVEERSRWRRGPGGAAGAREGAQPLGPCWR